MKTYSGMNPANPSEAAIFEAALACATPQERAAYLDQACAGQPELRQRVEALLAAHEDASKFLEPKASARPTIRLTLPEEQVGERIGRYKLLQKIGEGGCGVVYMAEQEEPVRRRVALKVIKLGMDTKQVVARFEAERQALALMDHPNIAKVLDAGATEAGRPFFVMELVKGIPATRYADENKLDTRQRLDLFIQICQAVQHAHQKGIIHRDLKPSNVLVADHDGTPVPKVIDFGIAKATTDQRLTDKTLFTALEQFIGTPAYMSPEQAKLSGLDVDTRSDIYSLGVLLYELLTGKTPFDARRLLDAGFDEIRRIIREEEPVKPSTRLTQELVAADVSPLQSRGRNSGNIRADSRRLLQEVEGDLDWIVMKCLEKDRTRRYETANGLAADVQRHLSNEPVVACPPSAAYRFQKMVRRNKAAFAITTTVVSLVVIGFSVSLWLIRGKNAALERALTAEKIQLRASRELEAKHLLETAHIEMGKTFVWDNGPYSIGSYESRSKRDLQESAAASDGGEATLRKALVLQKELLGADSFEVAQTYETLAAVLAYDPTNTISSDSRLQEARELVHDALRIKRNIYGSNSLEVADALWRSAYAPFKRPVAIPTSTSERIRLLQECVSILRKQFDGHHRCWADFVALDAYQLYLSSSFLTLSELLLRDSRFAEAQDVSREAIEVLNNENRFHNSHPSPDRWVERNITQFRIITARSLLAQGKAGSAEMELKEINYSTNFDAVFAESGVDRKELREAINAKIEIYTALQQTNNVALWQEGLRKLDELEQKNSLQATQARAEAEALRADKADQAARETLANSDFAQATGLIDRSAAAEAVPFLVRSLTLNPTSEAALTQLFNLLNNRIWLLPTVEFTNLPPVKYARFTPDGSMVVAICTDQKAYFVDAKNGHILTSVKAATERHDWFESERTKNLQFNADGSRLLTYPDSNSCNVQVWDSKTGKPLNEPFPLVGARLDASGTRVVGVTTRYKVEIRDASNGGLVIGPFGDEDMESATFSDDGTKVLTKSMTAHGRIWDARTGEPLSDRFEKPDVEEFAFAGDGGRILSKSGRPPRWDSSCGCRTYTWVFDEDGWLSGGQFQIWDTATGKPIGMPFQHEHNVGNFNLDSDGNRIVTACDDKAARIWDARTGQLVVPPMWHESKVTSAEFSANGKRVLTRADDGMIRLWDAMTGKAITESYQVAGVALELSPDGTSVLITTPEGRLQVLSESGFGQSGTELNGLVGVASADISPDGEKVLALMTNNSIQVLHLESQQLLALPAFASKVTSVEFNADGAKVMVVSADNACSIWDAATGQPLEHQQMPPDVYAGSFSPDGARLASLSTNGWLTVIDVRSGTNISRSERVEEIAKYKPTIKFFPVGDRIGVETTAELMVFGSTDCRLIESPFTKNSGRWMAGTEFSVTTKGCLVRSDFKVTVVDAETGAELVAPMTADNSIEAAIFSRDGRRVITRSTEGTKSRRTDSRNIRIWDAASGLQLAGPFVEQNNHLTDGRLSKDNRQMLTMTPEGKVRVHLVGPPEGEMPGWFLQMASAISHHSINKHGVVSANPAAQVELLERVSSSIVSTDRTNAWTTWGRNWLSSNRAQKNKLP